MRIVDDITAHHLAYWDGLNPVLAEFAPPADLPNCEPAKAVVTNSGQQVVRVAWIPNEIELAALAQGGTIWLSTWGGLPPHMLEVQPPATENR